MIGKIQRLLNQATKYPAVAEESSSNDKIIIEQHNHSRRILQGKEEGPSEEELLFVRTTGKFKEATEDEVKRFIDIARKADSIAGISF